MPLSRVLEAEAMDSKQEAIEYDTMPLLEVNSLFAARACALAPPHGTVLDAGTGTARIPILMCEHGLDGVVIAALDLSEPMLRIGLGNVARSGLTGRVRLQQADVKRLPFQLSSFEMVVSNSLVHHLADPRPFFQEIARVLKPEGSLLLRDLIRPESEIELERLVDVHAAGDTLVQRRLFADSLRAALTLDEVAACAAAAGLARIALARSSDRHWSIERNLLA